MTEGIRSGDGGNVTSVLLMPGICLPAGVTTVVSGEAGRESD
ncbi:hypothetical protein SEEM1594_02664, partial [Salmonella enterica subsp. enterica serovar Muenchen str. baa1594]